MHLVDKHIVNGKLQRQRDTPQTPYQRVLSSGILTPEETGRLAKRYAQTTPRQLLQDIHQALDQLLRPPQTLPAQYKY